MRSAIIIVLMTVACGSAAADWIKVAELGAGSIFVDPATIRRDGNVAAMGTLYHLKTPVLSKTNGQPYASQKLQSEYDCKDEQWRVITSSWHSKNMGEGKMVEYLADARKWENIPRESGVKLLWELACENKWPRLTRY